MGVGKTIEAIGVINDNSDCRKVLVVCPASLKLNWRIELGRWLVRRATTVGLATTRRWSLADIVIVNYEALKANHRAIHATPWDLVILDEAHRVRNAHTRAALEIYGRKHKDPLKTRPTLQAQRWLLLTGTPIVNRPFEIYPLVHHLAPDEFPSRATFIREYCGGRAKGQNKTEIGEHNLQRLHEKLKATVMIRRTKAEVLPELPKKVRQVIVLPNERVRGALHSEQQSFVEIQRTLSILRLRAELAKAVPDDVVYARAVKALRQCEFTSIQRLAKVRAQTALAKVPLVVDHVLSILDHENKVVVFAHHIAVAENIALEFGKAVAIAHGKVPVGQRLALVHKFQTDPGCRVFVGTMKVLGEGFTLTAASTCVFAELDWTSSTLEQAADRLHRIGQQDCVLVQHLVIDGSIDAMIARRVIEKQETISAALDGGDTEEASLYALSQATPFVEEDRKEILRLGETLTQHRVNEIHDVLRGVARDQRRGVRPLDRSLMQILGDEDYLTPAQAALGYALLKKYSTKEK